jgi:peptidyl-tRNA hydrolase, PTH1 family
MQLIVGLGNPGDEYRRNRHNIGFLAVDAIARRHGFPPFRTKFHGFVTDGTIDGERVLLLKPQTFMNRSGDSVAAAVQFYKLSAEDVTVFHDELDLAPGKARIKRGGSNGGHNGLRSIDPQIGANYRRVRLGIGHPGHKTRVNAHVLSDFHKIDYAWLEPLLDAIGDNAGLLVTGDEGSFMNKLALATQAPGEAEPKPEKPAGKGQSHIRQARATPPQAKVPESGPMAAMLRRLFHKD